MIAPFELLTIFPFSDEFLKKYNTFLCHLIYLPVMVTVTTYFIIANVLWIPFAYLKQTLLLI